MNSVAGALAGGVARWPAAVERDRVASRRRSDLADLDGLECPRRRRSQTPAGTWRRSTSVQRRCGRRPPPRSASGPRPCTAGPSARRQAGAHAVGALHVELHVVDVHVRPSRSRRTPSASVISVVSVTATQSPMLARIASGSAQLAAGQDVVLVLGQRRRSCRRGRSHVGVTWIGSSIATMLNVRTVASGRAEPVRAAGARVGALGSGGAGCAFSPSHGAPVCPLRRERWSLADVRSQQRVRRSAVVGVEQDHRSVARRHVSTGSGRPKWFGAPGRMFGRSGSGRVLGLAEVERRGRRRRVDLPVPDGRRPGRCAARPAAAAAARSTRPGSPSVSVVPSGIGLADQLRRVDGGRRSASRSGSGTRSGCRVSKTRQMLHMPET